LQYWLFCECGERARWKRAQRSSCNSGDTATAY